MAQALLEHDGIKASVRMCITCHGENNIGCYECHRGLDCSALPMAPNGIGWLEWREVPAGFRRQKYCRSCAVSTNKFCSSCDEYLCPTCSAHGNFQSCEDCHSIVCYEVECGETFTRCTNCRRAKCEACMAQSGEGWGKVNWDPYCPTCIVNAPPAEDDY